MECINGNLKFSFQSKSRVVGSPVVGCEIVSFSSNDGNHYGLDVSTGSKEWIYTPEKGRPSAPVLFIDRLSGEEIIAFQSTASQIHFLSAREGTVIRKFPIDGSANVFPPVVLENFLIAQVHTGVISVFDVHSGIKLWNGILSENSISRPAVNNNDLFVAERGGKVFWIKQGEEE